MSLNGLVVTAKEIIKQSEQGYSVQPFIIRADDNEIYFVKGFNKAGPIGLVSEVLAAQLGKLLGLPIPDWRFMQIPQELIDFSIINNIQDLSGGIAFASQQVPNARDLLYTSIDKVSPSLQLLVLIFDYWIQNQDRNLSSAGGNVNLLLSDDSELSVIDHNGAFYGDFNIGELLELHVFKDVAPLAQDLATRAELEKKFSEALNQWCNITQCLPAEWLYHYPDLVDKIKPTLEDRLDILNRFTQNSFWGQL